MENGITEKLLKMLKSSNEPMETSEILSRIKTESRTKVMYRLNDLRGQGLIKGKRIGSGKGSWIWWRADAFS